jgi:sugar phosphate permease
LITSWNGLAFTAAGELAPPGLVGTALGLQGTANYLVASIAPPLMGVALAFTGFAWGFALIAFPCAAAGLLLARR